MCCADGWFKPFFPPVISLLVSHSFKLLNQENIQVFKMRIEINMRVDEEHHPHDAAPLVRRNARKYLGKKTEDSVCEVVLVDFKVPDHMTAQSSTFLKPPEGFKVLEVSHSWFFHFCEGLGGNSLTSGFKQQKITHIIGQKCGCECSLSKPERDLQPMKGGC